MKQQLLLLRVMQAWWLQMQRAAAARNTAERIAAERQRWLLQQALQALACNVQHSMHKKQQMQRAEQFCIVRLLHSCWSVWSHAVAEARMNAAQRVQQSEQLLLRVALHWQRLSTAAAAAAMRGVRLQQLQTRRERSLLSSCFLKWQCWTLQESRAAKAEGLCQVQQQLVALQQQVQQEQQQVAGVAELQQQLAGLQQQLEAALTSKAGLEAVSVTRLVRACLGCCGWQAYVCTGQACTQIYGREPAQHEGCADCFVAAAHGSCFLRKQQHAHLLLHSCKSCMIGVLSSVASLCPSPHGCCCAAGGAEAAAGAAAAGQQPYTAT
jgi:hypothetical protein